ncbi:MAG: DNA repair protein RecN [Acidobacteriota bacterium]
MLRELEVRDLGIIDALRVELPPGFIVLTGETGAGKSLLVQSLQLLAGERADSGQVRGGSERLLVEGCFERPRGEQVRTLLTELGITDSDELVLRREVTASGRSRSWVNDVPVTVGALQRLSPDLLAIHGQHEQRGLADPATHLALVDAAGGLLLLRSGVEEAFRRWSELDARLAEQRRALSTRRDRLDVIAFQLREIGEAHVASGEEEKLREERTLLRHGERIGLLLTTARGELGGEGGTVALARATRAVRELVLLGITLGDTADALAQAQVLGEDAERELSSLADRIRVDPERLEEVESRLALLERLARKYGGSSEAILAHARTLEEERGRLEGAETDIARLEIDEGAALADYLARAIDLSTRRAETARSFVREVVAVLERLGMGRTRLDLRLTRREDPEGRGDLGGIRVAPAPDGIDVGELVISPNPGEELRPLARIASGGELSRMHLAIRTVLRERASRDALTLLFDEVDAGIGGRVAEELGQLLADLGRRDQVLVVTHLPQVAAAADAHFMVTKRAQKGRTVTRVTPVAGEERVGEVVRMLGGGPDTPAAEQHARQMLRERTASTGHRG